MNRRDFLKVVSLTTAAAVVAPRLGPLARPAGPSLLELDEGDIVYFEVETALVPTSFIATLEFESGGNITLQGATSGHGEPVTAHVVMPFPAEIKGLRILSNPRNTPGRIRISRGRYADYPVPNESFLLRELPART